MRRRRAHHPSAGAARGRGDAVAHCETDAASIGRELAALLDDPDRRTALSSAARSGALEFTWAATAQAHLAAYERASSGA